MLADEMTTGSVTTSDADKRAFAARSHAWNLEQRRFKEAFPDVRTIYLHLQLLSYTSGYQSRLDWRTHSICVPHLPPSCATVYFVIRVGTAPVN